MNSFSSKELRVIDTSCTPECPKRVHTVRVGGELHHITFEFDKETILPREIALKFNVEGFVLTSPDGSKTFEAPPKTDELIQNRIADHEVIATYDELMASALKLRVMLENDGDIFIQGEPSRDEMIKFLMDAKKNKSQTTEEGPSEGDDLPEETFSEVNVGLGVVDETVAGGTDAMNAIVQDLVNAPSTLGVFKSDSEDVSEV